MTQWEYKIVHAPWCSRGTYAFVPSVPDEYAAAFLLDLNALGRDGWIYCAQAPGTGDMIFRREVRKDGEQ